MKQGKRIEDILLFEIDIVQDDANGVTSIALHLDKGLNSVGTSRRHPNDKQNATLGYQLAVGRALKALGRNLEREAYAAVHVLDEARAAQQAMMAKRVKLTPKQIEKLKAQSIASKKTVVLTPAQKAAITRAKNKEAAEKHPKPKRSIKKTVAKKVSKKAV